MSLFNDASKVLTGITLQRVISLLMVPVIARLLGPTDYGIFQVALSICALVSVAGSLSLEASIAVADSKMRAGLRTIGTSIIGILSAFLFWAIAYLLQPYLARYFSMEIAKTILIVSPTIIPLTIISTSFRNYVGYLGKFGSYAIADIVSPIAGYAALVSSYFLFWKDYRALIVGGVTSLVFNLIIFAWAIKGSKLFRTIIDTQIIVKELWQVRDFIKFYLPANFLNTASVQFPTTLLALAFPESVVGLFTMALSIISIPTTLSGRALGQVFYPKAAKEYREGRGLGKITWQTFVYSCQLALFPLFFIAASAGFILPTILGSKWNGVAPYIVLLLPMVLINALETQIGIGFIFSILNQQFKILTGNLLLFVCRLLPLLVFVLVIPSPYVTVFAYSVGSAIGYTILLIWILVSVRVSLKKAFYTLAKYCLISALCVLPIFLSVLNDQMVLLLLYLFISALLYGLITWFKFLNPEQRSSIISQTYGRLFVLKNKRETV